MEERADEEDIPWAVVVVEFADERTAKEHHEGFEGRDPGYGAGREAGKLVGLIVFLKDTDALDIISSVYEPRVRMFTYS